MHDSFNFCPGSNQPEVEDTVRERCLTSKEREAIGATQSAVDYKKVDYRNLCFDREIGLEGSDGDQLYHFGLSIYNRQALEVIREEFAKSDDDLALVVIGIGHTLSTKGSVPSIQDLLHPLGVSTVGVLPPQLSYGVNINSGLITIIQENEPK